MLDDEYYKLDKIIIFTVDLGCENGNSGKRHIEKVYLSENISSDLLVDLVVDTTIMCFLYMEYQGCNAYPVKLPYFSSYDLHKDIIVKYDSVSPPNLYSIKIITSSWVISSCIVQSSLHCDIEYLNSTHLQNYTDAEECILGIRQAY